MVNLVLFNEKCKYTLSEFEFLHDPADKNCKLGSGSFASVKLAKEKKTGQLFALKIVRLNNLKSTSADVYNIRAEIYIHRKLNHPNIVRFHDYIQQDPNVYLILDYAENGNLYSYMHKKKYLSDKEIFRFFHQTCLAVQYLHENDVLHRDLKPENLLLDSKNNIKLCDFGWATQRIKEKRLTFCGTYEYMAPEIVYKRPYDYRVDIWSLGVLLYELIHNAPPYKGRSLSDICRSLSRGLVKFSANCNPRAKDLIERILKQNPTDRPTMTQILSHPWVQEHLTPAENTPTPSIPPTIPLLLHSHSQPVEHTMMQEEPPKKVSEPQTPRNANSNAPQYETWAEYLKRKQPETPLIRGISDPTPNSKNCSEAKRFKVNEVEEVPKRVLQPSNSNRSLNINLTLDQTYSKIIDESCLLTAKRQVSPSPKSPNMVSQNQSMLKTPPKHADNNKIFEKNIFSPSFKSKLTSVIRQLTVQPSTEQTTRRDDKSLVNQTSIQQSNQNSSVMYNSSSNNNQSATYYQPFYLQDETQDSNKKYYVCEREEDKILNNIAINTFSINGMQSRQDVKATHVLYHMKNNFKEQMNHPKGDDLPVTYSSTSTTRTNTSDISYGADVKSPFAATNRDAYNKGKVVYKNDKEPMATYNEKSKPNKQIVHITSTIKDKPQGVMAKKALELKGMLGSNIIRYQIPIALSTSRQGRNKENVL